MTHPIRKTYQIGNILVDIKVYVEEKHHDNPRTDQ